MAIGLNFPSVLLAARQGADWAWTEIYRDLAPTVLRYLQAHGARDAEDVLGETFVQIVRRLPDFEGGEIEFRAWVFTIARSRAVDQWRYHERRPVEFGSDDEEHERAGVDDTEATALGRLSYERVMRALEKLTPQQRDVIFLRIIAGLPIEQVAAIVEKPPGAVKSLQSRGLAAIRKEISGEAVS